MPDNHKKYQKIDSKNLFEILKNQVLNQLEQDAEIGPPDSDIPSSTPNSKPVKSKKPLPQFPSNMEQYIKDALWRGDIPIEVSE